MTQYILEIDTTAEGRKATEKGYIIKLLNASTLLDALQEAEEIIKQDKSIVYLADIYEESAYNLEVQAHIYTSVMMTRVNHEDYLSAQQWHFRSEGNHEHIRGLQKLVIQAGEYKLLPL